MNQNEAPSESSKEYYDSIGVCAVISIQEDGHFYLFDNYGAFMAGPIERLEDAINAVPANLSLDPDIIDYRIIKCSIPSS